MGTAYGKRNRHFPSTYKTLLKFSPHPGPSQNDRYRPSTSLSDFPLGGRRRTLASSSSTSTKAQFFRGRKTGRALCPTHILPTRTPFARTCPLHELRTMGTVRARLEVISLLERARASVMAPSPSSTSPSPVRVDRLGALPDLLILHILSFLPTLAAVRTSVLSTRWRTLWTSVGAFDLDEDHAYFGTGEWIGGRKRKRKGMRFEEFVRKVLSFNHKTKLHKLRLRCRPHNPRQVTDWVIRAAVSREVRTLDLCLPRCPEPDGNAGRLPPPLFTCQSLVELQLDLGGSALILPGTMALVGLRRMRLCRVKFCDDHSTRSLFSSSTALRSLVLKDCDYQNLGCLEISCSSLQELSIDSLYEADGLGSCQVKIVAPQLNSFVYRASVAQSYVVEPLSCVEYVKIQFQRFEAQKGSEKHSILNRASSFFSSLSSARNLDICPVCVQALKCRRKISEVLILFCNLNVLRTAVKHLDYRSLFVVLGLVLLNPQLRALTVEVEKLSVLPSARKEVFFKFLGDRFGSWNGVMERVEIRCPIYSSSRAAMSYTTETVLELVKVLLGSQPRLSKLILSNFFWDYRQGVVIGKVMSFPRCAREFAVVFI